MDDTPDGYPSLADLTRAMAAGDDCAWQHFHRVYGPPLFRHLLGQTRGDHTLAMEAIQGAYLRIARHVHVCDNEVQFAAWLRISARSELLDLRRRRSRFVAALQRWWNSGTVDATDPGEDTSLLDALDQCRARLDPDIRELLDAKYLRGETVAAIAARTGLSAKAVESRLTRARETLRALLQQELTRHD